MLHFRFQARYIPNLLTVFRIALVPIIITFMLVTFGPVIYTAKFQNDSVIVLKLNLLLAAILFVIASVTDALDGYLARKFHWISNFGKFWDPIADKILVNATLFTFAAPQLDYVPIWIPIILLSRDLIVDGLRFTAAKQNLVIAANWPGKIKTIVLMVATVIVFWIGGHQANVSALYFWAIQNLLFLIALVLAIASGIIYFQRYFQTKKSKQTVA